MALVVTAIIQLQINPTLPNIPPNGRSFVSFVNGLDECGMTVGWVGEDSPQQRYVPPRESLSNHKNVNATSIFDVPAGKNVWRIAYNGTCDRTNLPEMVTFETNSTAIHYVSVNSLGAYIGTADPSKPTDGNGDFSLGIDLALSDYDYTGHLALCRVGTKGTTADHPCDPTRPADFYFWEDETSKKYSDAAGCGFDDMRGRQDYTQAGGRIFDGVHSTQYAFKPVRPGNWSLYYLLNTPKCIGRQSYNSTFVRVNATGINIVRYAPGGVYLLIVDGTKNN
ncbi:CRE-PEPT-1 protein, partial [Aphelenchoides avenae]